MPYDYCVYVIEVDDDPFCVYVGQTYLTPDERLAQHCAGYKSAPSLRHARKLELRPDIYGQIGRFKTREEALSAETTLANGLTKIGYKVLGGH